MRPPLDVRPGHGRWNGTFAPLGGSIYGRFIEFDHVRPRTGLLHDEEDACSGRWMMRDGVLAEVPHPGHRRLQPPAPTTDEFPPDPGLLWRTEKAVPSEYATSRQDQRPAW
ncbi:hypothetical protein ACFW1A_31025 [Kitasatospora sp. NPDC058965]|uniref:hypothetical protein n=1 Tax=Kitasatospora sp. NPDC058965 TaxID=3346682 RepID=UPI00368BD8A3